VEEKQIHDDLASIRSLMERSSKFISLSGLSGILAGVYALIGAGLAYYDFYVWGQAQIYLNGKIVKMNELSVAPSTTPTFNRYDGIIYNGFLYHSKSLFLIAVLVLITSICTGVILTVRKAKQKKQQVWGRLSRSLLFNMAVPLCTGGSLIIVFIIHHYYDFIIPSCLVFYGISLVAASNFTFTDVKYLGLSEIFIGLIAACLPGYGLLFWAIGFGVLHIVYGSMMYFKYDR